MAKRSGKEWFWGLVIGLPLASLSFILPQQLPHGEVLDEFMPREFLTRHHYGLVMGYEFDGLGLREYLYKGESVPDARLFVKTNSGGDVIESGIVFTVGCRMTDQERGLVQEYIYAMSGSAGLQAGDAKADSGSSVRLAADGSTNILEFGPYRFRIEGGSSGCRAVIDHKTAAD